MVVVAVVVVIVVVVALPRDEAHPRSKELSSRPPLRAFIFYLVRVFRAGENEEENEKNFLTCKTAKKHTRTKEKKTLSLSLSPQHTNT